MSKLKAFYIFLFFLISILFYFTFLDTKESKDLKQYLDIIATQEKVLRNDIVTQQEIDGLTNCRRSDDCVRNFYKNYTLKNGVEKSFRHLVKIQKDYPDFISSCHYLTHGIGHASLVINKNDVPKAFSILSTDIFRNIATCGNGYFHGVIEEYTKKTFGKEELIKKLSNVCDKKNQLVTRGACLHGVGHAILIQLDYDLDSALFVCSEISDSGQRLMDCNTGVFMEYAQNYNDYYEVKDRRVVFKLCDSLDKKLQPACYMEQSSVFEDHTNEPRNYTRNIGFCKQISDPVNRLACIKLFAIRAVRISRYEYIKEMCANTSTDVEKVFCTAVVASRIANSIDIEKNQKIHSQVIKDTCGTLNFFYKKTCEYIVYESDGLFYTKPSDLELFKLVFHKRFY
jgi:hypothetical protein